MYLDSSSVHLHHGPHALEIATWRTEQEEQQRVEEGFGRGGAQHQPLGVGCAATEVRILTRAAQDGP